MTTGYSEIYGQLLNSFSFTKIADGNILGNLTILVGLCATFKKAGYRGSRPKVLCNIKSSQNLF